MSSHTEPCDGLVCGTHMEIVTQDLGKFVIDIAVHVEVLLVLVSSRITVITSSVAPCPVLVDTLQSSVSGRSVREHNGNLVLLSELGEP